MHVQQHRVRENPLHQPGQHGAGTDFDKGGHAHPAHDSDRLLPQDRGGKLPDQGGLHLRRPSQRLGVRVVDQRHRQVRPRRGRHVAGQAISRCPHQRGMDRHADRQRNRLPAALGLGQLDRPLDRSLLTGDHHLPRTVEVRRGHHADRRRLTAGVANRLAGQAEDRRHQPTPGRDGLGHIPSPLLHQRDRGAEGEPPRGHQRRVLAETVTGYRDGPETGRFQESQGRDAGCEQGGLCVFRQIQAFARSVEA